MYATLAEITKLQEFEPINFEQHLEKIYDFYFQTLIGVSRREAMELIRFEVLKNLKIKQQVEELRAKILKFERGEK